MGGARRTKRWAEVRAAARGVQRVFAQEAQMAPQGLAQGKRRPTGSALQSEGGRGVISPVGLLHLLEAQGRRCSLGAWSTNVSRPSSDGTR